MFKERFKYYKSKNRPPNLGELIGHSSPDSDVRLRKVPAHSVSNTDLKNVSDLGLISPLLWNIYEVTCCPGLWFVLNPFTSSGQREWCRQALVDYTKPPNRLNLHAHGDLGMDEDWWDICQRDTTRRETLYKKLRWTTIGYHHDWDSKVYKESNKSEFPSTLQFLCSFVAHKVGGWCVKAEAAIINYYHFGSTLSGHTDHSEIDLSIPLVSFSFGQSAVFLIGGQSLEEECHGLLLRSGDVIIMSGQSRLCYHGVPMILRAEYSPWKEDVPVNPIWTPILDYLEESRININIRQVLPPEKYYLS